ncbi:MFS transporter, partial [Streptomyces hawaiiensis]
MRLVTDLGTPTRGAATGTGDRSRPRAALPDLCVTQIVSWGIVYYANPVHDTESTSSKAWRAGATTS